jgi:hypothetical protein
MAQGENTVTDAATQQSDEDTNIIPFERPQSKVRAITGGKPPENMLWLREIPEGYGFLCRMKGQANDRKAFCTFFQKVGALDVCARLYEGNSQQFVWVHMDDFSRTNECLEVIPIVYPDQDEEPRNEQGTSDIDTTGLVADPGLSEGVDSSGSSKE